jgi:tartrate dehydrogenase/decarboxylase/D-malate dehydrogenase
MLMRSTLGRAVRWTPRNNSALWFCSISTHSIAVYPGDGIGVDVSEATFHLLEAMEDKYGFELETEWYPWGCDYYDKHGKAAPDDMIETLRPYDAVFLGAVGYPSRLPDHITLEPLIRMRQAFDQFACVRPARTFDGVPSPLAGEPHIDMIVVRENSEGEYVNCGGRLAIGQPSEVAVQSAVHTRRGVERVLRYGFDLARRPDRRKRLTMVTKSNAQRFGMTLWDDVLDEISPEYPDVDVDKQHVDACAMNFIRQPEQVQEHLSRLVSLASFCA